MPEGTAGRRKLIDLVYLQGLSGVEAAEALGRPAESVYVSLTDTRRRLRECINRRLGRPAEPPATRGKPDPAATVRNRAGDTDVIPFDLFPAPGADDPTWAVLREYWYAPDRKSLPEIFSMIPSRLADAREYLTEMDVAPTAGPAAKLATRVIAIVRAPSGGEYVFRVSGAPLPVRAVGTDGPDGQRRVLAQVLLQKSTPYRVWDKFPEQKSRAVHPQGGVTYRLTLCHATNTDRGHMSVGWTLPDETAEWPLPAGRFVRRPDL